MGSLCKGSYYQEDTSGHTVLDKSGSLEITADALQIGVMVVHCDAISIHMTVHYAVSLYAFIKQILD
jgi:hypothetical protein